MRVKRGTDWPLDDKAPKGLLHWGDWGELGGELVELVRAVRCELLFWLPWQSRGYFCLRRHSRLDAYCSIRGDLGSLVSTE